MFSVPFVAWPIRIQELRRRLGENAAVDVDDLIVGNTEVIRA
jgi:hypothetical protein